MPPELAAALAEVDAEDEAARRGGQGRAAWCGAVHHHRAALSSLQAATPELIDLYAESRCSSCADDHDVHSG